ncbi:MAG TPA: outer membrane lipoprotein carrier protein LolA [Anaeromyxobacteraceae bacterium]|nr:outer membrane lipoprotein carrier protein LolA [Anaeromyxobacteraceae bacterium]
MRILAVLLAVWQVAPGEPTVPPAAPGEKPAEARDLARAVQAFYERTRDLEATFVQTYSYAAGGRRQVSRGTLRVKKPGRMRWDYQSPEPKTVAVVGSRLVQWEPEANQVYVDDRFDATAMSAAVTFLLGQGKLESEFHLASDGPRQLVLRPRKPDPRVESVTLTVGPEGQVTATRVEDGQGNVNQVALEGIRRNVGLKDSDFEVKVPKDAHRIAPPGQ